MQENPENNERIQNNETYRTDSKQMWALDGKQKLFGVISLLQFIQESPR